MAVPIHGPLLTDFRELRRFKRLLIFGGSFDPPTRAHFEIPEVMRARMDADVVLYVPAAKNPLKSTGPRVSNEDRLAMLCAGLRYRSHALATDYEMRREGPSYTVQLLRDLRAAVGYDTELILFVGSDCVRDFPAWKNIDEIFELAQVVSITRQDDKTVVLRDLEGRLAPEIIERLEKSFVVADTPDISSTQVREALAQGIIPTEMLDSEVSGYIAQKGLYGYRRS